MRAYFVEPSSRMQLQSSELASCAQLHCFEFGFIRAYSSLKFPVVHTCMLLNFRFASTCTDLDSPFLCHYNS